MTNPRMRRLPTVPRRDAVARFIGRRVTMTVTLSATAGEGPSREVRGLVRNIAILDHPAQDLLIIDVAGGGLFPHAYPLGRIVEIHSTSSRKVT